MTQYKYNYYKEWTISTHFNPQIQTVKKLLKLSNPKCCITVKEHNIRL